MQTSDFSLTGHSSALALSKFVLSAQLRSLGRSQENDVQSSSAGAHAGSNRCLPPAHPPRLSQHTVRLQCTPWLPAVYQCAPFSPSLSPISLPPAARAMPSQAFDVTSGLLESCPISLLSCIFMAAQINSLPACEQTEDRSFRSLQASNPGGLQRFWSGGV